MVFSEVHDQLNPLLPVVVIKGMDGMISLVEEFVYDRAIIVLSLQNTDHAISLLSYHRQIAPF